MFPYGTGRKGLCGGRGASLVGNVPELQCHLSFSLQNSKIREEIIPVPSQDLPSEPLSHFHVSFYPNAFLFPVPIPRTL